MRLEAFARSGLLGGVARGQPWSSAIEICEQLARLQKPGMVQLPCGNFGRAGRHRYPRQDPVLRHADQRPLGNRVNIFDVVWYDQDDSIELAFTGGLADDDLHLHDD